MYCCTVTDIQGCTETLCVNIEEPAPLAINFYTYDVICFASNDGIACATPTGGTFPYTYQWNDISNQTTQCAVGLDEGTYVVMVTDSNLCTVIDSVNIFEPSEMIVTIDSMTPVSCPTCCKYVLRMNLKIRKKLPQKSNLFNSVIGS